MDPMALLAPVFAGAAAALVVALALSRVRRRWVPALALATAFVVARLVVMVPAGFPPTYVDGWGVFLMPVFAALALLELHGRMATPVAWIARTLASFGVAYLYLAPNADFRDAPLAIALNGAAILALWGALASLSRNGPRILLLGAYGVPLAGAAVAIGVSYMASVGQVAGGLALGSAVALGLTWKQPAADVGRATTPVFVFAFAALLLSGGYYTDDFPREALALLAVSPLFAWTGRLPFLAGLSERSRIVLGAAATIAVCAAAVWLGWPPPQEETGW